MRMLNFGFYLVLVFLLSVMFLNAAPNHYGKISLKQKRHQEKDTGVDNLFVDTRHEYSFPSLLIF
jgi:hypothetical protein